MKKIPERTCTGCGISKPKNELLRIVKDKENNITIDLTGKKMVEVHIYVLMKTV